MTKKRERTSFRDSDFVILWAFVTSMVSTLIKTSAESLVGHMNHSHNEAAPERLRRRTQGAFFTWFRAGSLLHPSAHYRASIFQLGDLESEQRNADTGDWSRTTQLCQPCFQGDLALGDNTVFRFHSLELPTRSLA
jgi:hypothetical protein